MEDLKTILESKPKVKNYDLQPYGYIKALQDYVDKLEAAINYTHRCETLKAKKAPHFYDWLKVNKVDFFDDLLLYKGDWVTIGDLYVKYKKEFNIPF